MFTDVRTDDRLIAISPESFGRGIKRDAIDNAAVFN